MTKRKELTSELTINSGFKYYKHTDSLKANFLEQHGRELKGFSLGLSCDTSVATLFSEVCQLATGLRRLTLLPKGDDSISNTVTKLLLSPELFPNLKELNLNASVPPDHLAFLCCRR